MNERKIMVSEGMLSAAMVAVSGKSWSQLGLVEKMLEAALKWLSENPIIPSIEQAVDMYDKFPVNTTRNCCVEWQRRMFLSPEPAIPEEIKDLMMDRPHSDDILSHEEVNAAIMEAYQRGKAAR
jgi:hypothetical protein